MLTSKLQSKKAKYMCLWLALATVFISVLVGCTGGYSGKVYNVSIKATDKNQYAFDQTGPVGQSNLTVLMYDSITFNNTTNEDLTLVSQPDGVLPAGSVVNKNNSLTIQFTKVGTWTISSKEHKELKMTVVMQ